MGILIGLLVIILGVVGVTQYTTHQPRQKQPRIVATTDAVVAIADKLDLKLVGVPKTQNALPKRYAGVTKIGSPMAPNIEKIAALKPTAVYAVSVLKDQYSEAFKAQKFHPQFLKLDTVSDLKQTLTTLGTRYDRTKQAKQQIAVIDRAEAKAKKRVHGPKTKVLILMGMPGAGYMIATDRSYVGNLVKKAGGENVYSSATSAYVSPNNESLATKAPDVILRLEHAMPEMVKPQFEQEFATNPLWAQMPAVKNQRVYDLQQPDFNATATIQAATALGRVSHWLYP
ncbi:MAG: heme ABC transporter substrate-binding protein IsdE [Lactobacillus sp.]|jgi:iron complex transport system substrate-binding protein|nr:heme ABC transporter substrate-binding protein IsdE [Lactobacillus sp.]MCI2032954.1 heme ABC transporter substrate-binding protein IsdE [Lactobacillus sp.]